MKSNEISKYLLENKFIATVPGSSFGPEGENYLRISYAESMKNLIKFVDRLKEFMFD
jgi:aspartate/methionine/tyrosine aminotransferase